MRWIKLFYVAVLLLSVCTGLSAQKTEERKFLNADTMVVRKYEDGKLVSESFYADYDEYRHRDYIYTDSTYGYFQYEVVKFVTKESVLYEFYMDGTRCTVASYYGRKMNGTCRGYYRSGNLQYEYHYENHKMEGAQYEYHENGQVSSSFTCVNDVIEGPYRDFHPNGNLKETGYIVHGNTQDTVKTYHDNGQLATVMIYKDDNPWEVVSSFDAQGNSRAMGTLRNGTGTVLNYDEKGVLEDSDVYQDGVYVESYWEWDLPDDGRPD